MERALKGIPSQLRGVVLHGKEAACSGASMPWLVSSHLCVQVWTVFHLLVILYLLIY